MKNRFMRGAALGLAMVTAFTFTAPNSALLSAEAAAKQATAATKITAKAASVKVGKTAKVKVTINKKATKKVTINVKAKNAKIAKVAKKLTIKKGKKAATLKVKGLKKGSTKLTLSFKNSKGKTVKKTIKVTVKKAAAAKVAATGVTLDKEAYTVGLGQTTTLFATVAPADTTDVPVWTSSDETVATVKDGVVTGVKEGTADVTVTYREGVSATAKVTVSKDAIVYNLTDVKQTASKKIQLTFDNAEAKNLTNDLKQIFVTNSKTALRNDVAKIDWSADGTVGVATLTSNLIDKDEYTVRFKEGGTPFTFTASVGEVSNAVILTASAEKGKETKIEFALYDANGVDVTEAQDVDSTVKFTADNTTALDNADKASKTTITMNNIGDTVTVTLTYTKTGASESIIKTGTITCVDNTALQGTGVFKVSRNLFTANNDSFPKFYLGESDTLVTAAADDDSVTSIYFYAKGEDGKALKYDEFEVKSSDENVFDIDGDTTSNSSKFVNISIDPKKEGSANIIVNATSYGKLTVYTIPVSIKGTAKFNSIGVKVNKSEITNAFDEDYYGEVQAWAVDSLGRKRALESPTVEITNLNENNMLTGASIVSAKAALVTSLGAAGTAYNSLDKGVMIANTNAAAATTWVGDKDTTVSMSEQGDALLPADQGFIKGSQEYASKAYYQAWLADVKGSVTLKVEGTFNDETKSKTINFSVKKLADATWAGTQSVSYVAVADDASVDAGSESGKTTKVRLEARVGNQFAGYVRRGATSDDAAMIGGVSADKVGSATAGSGSALEMAAAVNPTNTISKISQYIKSSDNSRIWIDNKTPNLCDSALNTVTTNPAADFKGAMLRNDSLYYQQVGMVVGVNSGTAAENGVYAPAGNAHNRYDKNFAKEYTYTVYFNYIENGKEQEKTGKFKVTNSLSDTGLSVSASSGTVESSSDDDIKDVLIVNACDWTTNNYDAINGLHTYTYSSTDKQGTLSSQTSSDNKVKVDYVAIPYKVFDGEGTNKLNVNILYNLGQSFNVK